MDEGTKIALGVIIAGAAIAATIYFVEQKRAQAAQQQVPQQVQPQYYQQPQPSTSGGQIAITNENVAQSTAQIAPKTYYYYYYGQAQQGQQQAQQTQQQSSGRITYVEPGPPRPIYSQPIQFPRLLNLPVVG